MWYVFFEKGSKNSKHNYQLIRFLKNISKVYERVMFKQMGNFMENPFPKFQCGFRKGYSRQQCLFAFIEKWKSAADKWKSFGALLTDLSKVFNFRPHELLSIIVKWVYQGNFKHVNFFLQKDFRRTKSNNDFHPIRRFNVPKKSLPLMFFVRLFLFLLVGFGWIAFLYPQNLFAKK